MEDLKMTKNVLLVCGSGASSGFMAANLRKAAKKAKKKQKKKKKKKTKQIRLTL